MRIVFAKYPARATVLLLAAAVVAAGCGSSHKADDVARGDTLTIYTSVPRHGVMAKRGQAVVEGERLALDEAHGRAAGRTVRLVELDDSNPQGGGAWDPSAVETNAKRAANDSSTIAYIGEFGLGGSAISVPVTNSKGVLQVSPEDGLTSLTRVQPGGPRTSPVRYYPNGRRTFVRLVPTDLEQVDELIASLLAQKAARVVIVHDDRLFGREMAAQTAAVAADRRVSVAANIEAPAGASSYADVARSVAAVRPDAVVYLGEAGPQAQLLLRTVDGAAPGARYYASSGLGAGSANRSVPTVGLLDPMLPPASYPPRSRQILARLAAQTGTGVPVDALYGYTAMRVVLDAIAASRKDPDDRTKVAAAAFAQSRRESAIGPFSVTATGDVTPARFASYRLTGGGATFQGIRTDPAR